MTNRSWLWLVCCGLLIGATGSLASIPGVKSTAISPATHVDGVITDWPTFTTVNKQVAVAAANDSDRLCLALATSDEPTKQRMMSAGLLVYVDVKGKKGETFGVRIPPFGGAIGRGRSGGGFRGGPSRGGGFSGGGPSQGQAPDDDTGHGLTVTYLEIIGPQANERHIVDLTQPKGFQVAIGDNAGTLLVELSLPLRADDEQPYALGVSTPGAMVGLGLVTPAIASTGGGMPGGINIGGVSIGGRGGGMGGRGGGMQNGAPRGAQGKALKVWTTVTLAAKA